MGGWDRETHVAFDIFLACRCSCLAKVQTHLCCWVANEAPEITAECPPSSTLAGLGLVWVAIAVGGWLLLLRCRWRGRSHHRDCGDMLRNWMVERR